jgi:hypothetical protein
MENMENRENTTGVIMDCVWWAKGQEQCSCERCTETLQPVRAAGLIPPFGADQEGWWEDAESRVLHAEALPPRRRRRKQARERHVVRLDDRQHRRSRKSAENSRKFEEAIASRMKAIKEALEWDPDPIYVSGLEITRNSTRETYILSRTRNTDWACYPDWV